MRFTYQYEGENTVLCFDTKGTRVTLSALKAEARRLSQLIIRERNTAYKDTISEYLSAAHQLIDFFENGREFHLSPIYLNVLIFALEDDKRHRKTARRIIREIRSVPKHRSMEIGGVFDFTALYGG